jgi:GntR family transcriptional repressor for pyruvate dehydrogenase complex
MSAPLKAQSIRRTSAADEVFKSLHEWIISGQLKPGDKLPAQEKLAEQFAVSRNTLREAIYKLTVMGFLMTRQGVGTVVNISNPASYMTALSDHLLLDRASVREFLEARFFVEKATVRLAVIRASPEDMTNMEHIIDEQVAAFHREDTEAFSKLDVEFHMALARASGNKVLLKFLETIWELLHKFIAEVSVLPGAIDHAIRFHRDILDLIVQRDMVKAERKIVQHLHDVVQTIERHMGVDLGADSLFD